MPDQLLYFNGVNGATGEYLLEPQAPDVISKILTHLGLDHRESPLPPARAPPPAQGWAWASP